MSTTLPRKVYDVNKAVVSVSIDTTMTVLNAVGDGVSSAVKILRDSGAIVVGQTRAAADRTMFSATRGAREVVGQTRAAADRTMSSATRNAREATGQARAQGERASARLDDVAERTARRVEQAVDDSPSTGTPYEQWTKAELYERAQELDVEGRSGMSKRQLITALRAH